MGCEAEPAALNPPHTRPAPAMRPQVIDNPWAPRSASPPSRAGQTRGAAALRAVPPQKPPPWLPQATPHTAIPLHRRRKGAPQLQYQ